MDRLSAGTDISFLIGATLIQVGVGQNDLQLRFEPKISINVQCDFAVERGDFERHRFECPMQGAPALFPLLHERVSGAAATPTGGLRLVFGDAGEIELFDDSDRWESFLIYEGDKPPIVI